MPPTPSGALMGHYFISSVCWREGGEIGPRHNSRAEIKTLSKRQRGLPHYFHRGSVCNSGPPHLATLALCKCEFLRNMSTAFSSVRYQPETPQLMGARSRTEPSLPESLRPHICKMVWFNTSLQRVM